MVLRLLNPQRGAQSILVLVTVVVIIVGSHSTVEPSFLHISALEVSLSRKELNELLANDWLCRHFYGGPDGSLT